MVNYGIKDCAKLAFYSKDDGKLFAYFPFGNSLKIGITGDKVECTANGSSIITWAANRKATAEITSQVISPKILTVVLGATNQTLGSGTMAQFESGVSDATSIYTLKELPSTGTLSVFLTEADGATVKSELTLTTNGTALDTEYKITGKVITLSAANKNKPILSVYAKDGTNIDVVTVKSNEFSKPYKIVGVGVVRGVDGVDRLQEITIPTATANSTADFTYDSSNPSSFTFNFDLSADPVTSKLVEFKSL